jgi:hypothetical protein
MWQEVITSASLCTVPPTVVFDEEGNGPWTAGGVAPTQVQTPGGYAVKSNGTTGYFMRNINIDYTVAKFQWLAASFVADVVSTTPSVVYSIASNGANSNAGNNIAIGTGTVAAIIGQFRRFDGTGGILNIVGPTAEVGKVYNVVWVAPTTNPVDAFMYVNGTRYIGATTSANGTGSVITYESVCGSRRAPSTFTNPSANPVMMLCRGYGKLPEQLARRLSENPWQIFGAKRKLVGLIVPSVQLLVPASDITTGTWAPSTGATLFGVLDETTADSADYIFTTANSDYAEVKLNSATDPLVSTGHILNYWIEPGSGSITVALKQGATTIASWTHTLTGSVQNISQTLTGTQADSITDYTDIRVSVLSGT